jgi:chorismate mutase/prephenate dehydratase
LEINEIRSQIDHIDQQIRALFLERMACAKKVGDYKATHGLPVLNRAREREILTKMRKDSGDMDLYIHRLFSTLFELSSAYQRSLHTADSKVRRQIENALGRSAPLFPQKGMIACQGVEGAYSQMAADKLFPRGNLVYFKTFDAVFDAVKSGLCDFGVLPIENSSYGSVRTVYDLLQVKDVNIVRSARLFIRHALFVKEGVSLSDIRVIYSHEQALGQCSKFLKSLGGKVKVIPCENTAAAAQIAAQSGDPGVAAISSQDCAKLYGLTPLPVSIQDSDNNYTRFICIAKEPIVYAGANRITLILSAEHRPGSLYEVLARLAALDINLIKLESRPIVGHDFDFLFFFECEASVLDPKVVSMLESLEQSCPSFTYLGNYAEV